VAHSDLLVPVFVVRFGAKYVGKPALLWWCGLERSQQSIPRTRSVPAPSSPALVRPYNAQPADGRRRQGQDLPATRDLGPSKPAEFVRSNPARAVIRLPNPPQKQGKSSPVDHFSIQPGSSVWPPALPHTVQAPRNAPDPVLPLPNTLPRALCAVRLNTQLSSINKAAHP
jgi:hypothetical protein